MRIGIDARVLTNKLTGIGVYLYKIIEELNEFDRENKYILYSNKKIVLDFQLNENWEIRENRFPIGSLWLQTKLVSLIKKDGIDIFWGPAHVIPFIKEKKVKYVVTIHDLALFKFKNIGKFYNTIIQKIMVKKSCLISNCIISVSISTAKDLKEIFLIDSKKIKVIYLGKKIKIENDAFNLKKKDKDNPYFLYLGTIEPRKNIDTLVRAFEKFNDENDLKFNLKIAGGLGWKYEDTLTLIRESKYANKIFLLGYVSEKEKTELLKGAEIFIFPSLYEGFGIPILEAMSYGLPVITSNVSSMPEVGGQAAIYINNPYNIEELKKRMIDFTKLNEDEKNKISKKCYEESLKFSWEKCATEILNIFFEMGEKN